MGREEHMDPSFDDDDFDEEFEDIDDAEREALHQDLLDVRTLKSVLGSRGVKGIVVFCADCEDDHFLGWDLLAGNLQEILESGRPPVHEPAWEPDPDEYVSWDYARGFLDGFETSTEAGSSGQKCGFCGSELPEGGYEWAYCPTCGKDLSVVNLVNYLRRQGWTRERVLVLLAECGFEPPAFEVEAPPSIDLTVKGDEKG